MSVGHLFMTNDNYNEWEEFKKREQSFILVVTDENKPEDSCVIETFIHSIHIDFSDLNHTHDNDKEIKIVRVDANQLLHFSQYEQNLLGKFPQLFVFKNSRYFPYKGDLKKPQFLSFVNKVLNPYITLTKEKQIEEFMNAKIEFNESSSLFKMGFVPLDENYHSYKQKFRGILVVFDKSQNPMIIRKYVEACQRLANREELRMGYIGDRARVQAFLNAYDEEFHFKGQKNLLVLVSDAGLKKFVDLDSNKELDIEEWINKNSIDFVHEIKDVRDAKLLSHLKTPLLILYLDESQRSHFILNHVQMLAGTYHQKLNFAFVIDPLIIDMSHEQGAQSPSLPTATIISNKGIIYPFRDEQFNTESLDVYIKRYITGLIRPLNNENFYETIDNFVEKLLQHTKFISISMFKQAVFDSTGKDILVFFYSTEKDSWANRKSHEQASFIDTTAQRFKDHEFNSVIVYSYDVYRNGLPEQMITGLDDVPSLYLYPANDKSSPVRFTEKFHKTRSHMEFVEKYGTSGIQLNERSHLPSRLVTKKDVKTPGNQHYDPRIKFDDL
eukprot:403364691